MSRRAYAGSGRYLDEFVRTKPSADLLALGLFPNAKEITESLAAYNAVRTHLRRFSLSDRGVTLAAVGDGHTPRTAALFAVRSAWTCHSVDPALRETGSNGVVGRPVSRGWRRIDRLTVHPRRIEDVAIEAERVVIVAVHSHAPLDAALRSVRAQDVAVVAMPCCVPQDLGAPPDVAYEDDGVWSPQRTIRVWRSVGGAS